VVRFFVFDWKIVHGLAVDAWLCLANTTKRTPQTNPQ